MKRIGLSYTGAELEQLENLGYFNTKGLRRLIKLAVELIEIIDIKDEKKIKNIIHNCMEQKKILESYNINEDLQQKIFTMGLYSHLKLKEES